MNVSSFRRGSVVVLLTLFMSVNFADKAVIGLAAPQLMSELNISPEQFGLIGSGFFLFFSLSGLLVGFLSNRIKSYYIILAMGVIWAITQFPVVIWGSFTVLMVSRLVLGAGEGPAFPMAMHAVFKWFPDDKRNLPTIFVQQGVNLGLMLSGPILTFFIVTYGWRSAFLFLGIAGFIWSLFWLFVGGEGQEQANKITEIQERAGRIPLTRLLREPTFVCISAIYFAEYVALAVYFTWLPAYLHQGLGYSQITAGWIFSGIAAVGIPATFLLGILSTKIRQAGYSSRVARGLLLSITPAIGGLAFILLYLPISPDLKVVLLCVGRVLSQTIFAFGPLLLAEVTPANQRGGVLGMMSCVGTIGGFVSPYAMGVLVQNAGGPSAFGYETGYAATGVLLLIVGVVGIFLVRPEHTIKRLQQALQPTQTTSLHPLKDAASRT